MTKMKSWQNNFEGKKITVMGLGLLGRGVGDAMFLAKHGAILTITDLKTKKELAGSVGKLSGFKDIKYVLGEHRLADFQKADFILKAAGVPLDSVYIAEARKHKIPIKMSASWLTELAPKVKTIGVTGTRGKSTVTHLVYKILKSVGKSVYLGGNVRGLSTLALLDKVRPKDYLVLELDSWQLQGFGEAKISPEIAVFTTFLDDHLNYYKNDRKKYFADKANIFINQTKEDVLIVGEDVKVDSRSPSTRANLGTGRSRIQDSRLKIAMRKDVPKGWKIKIPGEHNLLNIACAIEVGKVLKIPLTKIKKAVESYKGVEGRLQYLKTLRGVKIYNDNNATTPDATIAALRALSQSPTLTGQKVGPLFPRIILICGGADKGLDMSALVKEIPEHCKAVVLLSGSGSSLLTTNYSLPTKTETVENLKQALKKAFEIATKNDIVLFSPAFASFGLFKNEYDRNDQFLKIVKTL